MKDENVKITVDGETVEIPHSMIEESENGKGENDNE